MQFFHIILLEFLTIKVKNQIVFFNPLDFHVSIINLVNFNLC